MNRLLMSGMALAILTGGALAQAAATPPPGGPRAVAPLGAPMGAPPPGGPAAMVDDAGGPPPPPPGGPGGPGGRRPPLSKAAHIRLERGDTALDVKCADDEPMKTCSELTLQLLEKLQAMPSATGPKT